MYTPPIPDDEAARLQALREYDVLDTPAEEEFDRITRIASAIAGVPIALVSLVDENRQWFKSRVGLDAEQTPRAISFCGHAINGAEPLVVPDTDRDWRFVDNPLVTGEPRIRFYFGVPLTVPDGANVGTLCVIDREPRELTASKREALEDLATLTVRELELRKAALKDPLTDAFNRRMLSRMGDRELARARRSDRNFCFAEIDLDHFKIVNDTGDRILIETARSCESAIRGEDVLFRLGGEEFGVLLVDTDLASATWALERVRKAIEAQAVEYGGHSIRITASIGVTDFLGDGDTLESMIRRADAALYEAKNRGRNRIAGGVDMDGGTSPGCPPGRRPVKK